VYGKLCIQTPKICGRIEQSVFWGWGRGIRSVRIDWIRFAQNELEALQGTSIATQCCFLKIIFFVSKYFVISAAIFHAE